MLDAIEKSFQEKSTQELQKIYEEHDFDEWSEDAFVVIKKILESRGQSVADLNSFSKETFISKDIHYIEAANSALYTGATIKSIAVFGFVVMIFITMIFTKGSGTAILLSIVHYGLIATGVYGIGCTLSFLGMLLKKTNKK